MFAKAVFFFFALTTFVNAAPVKDYSAYPGVRPLYPIKVVQPLPGSGHELQPIAARDLSLDFTNDIGPDLDFDFDVDFNLALPPNKRSLLESQLLDDLKTSIDNLRTIIGLKVNKRDVVDLGALGSQILNGLRSHGLNEYIDIFSTRVQRLKDLPSNVPPSQIAAEADVLLREYNQVLAGLHVNKPVEARDIVVNAQVLAQLQNFISNTVSLLRALGKSDAVNTFLSQVNNLKAEARNGTLDAGDLLNAARDILASVL
jgi:hypothetical protein